MQNAELVTYIQTELHKGVSPEVIRAALLQAGWQTVDIDAAFMPKPAIKTKRTHISLNKILLGCITALFISSNVLSYIDEDMMAIWFLGAGLGAIVVLGYIVVGIIKRKMFYVKEAFIGLLIFGFVGFGTCMFNLSFSGF